MASMALALIAVGIVANIGLATDRSGRIAGVIVGGLLLLTGAVGALIAVRRSGHPVGWILISLASIMSINNFVQTYAQVGVERDLRGDTIAGWITTWIGAPAIGLFILLVLFFPTGTLPSPRWRHLVSAALVSLVGMSVGAAFLPGPLPAVPSVQNPLGIDALRIPLAVLSSVSAVVPAVCLLGAVASQVLRLRRARGEERQQIKLVAYAIVMVPVLVIVSQFLIPQGSSENQWVEFAVNVIAASVIPVSIGIAILRYRLFDIDRVINRTLVYGALTAVLAALYVGSVFAFQAVIGPFTSESDVAVAGSTLIVAALFRPLRTRVQAFIDRRFYRRRFDAQRTLERFGDHLRDEVNMNALTGQLTAVVADTMQPVHVSLWLRSGA
jgi:hypothetical protein